MKLFYKRPTEQLKIKKPQRVSREESLWEQTVLPIGNGNIGLSVYGYLAKEKLIVNHKTLWTGGPSASRPDYCGGNIIKADADGKTPYDYYEQVKNLFLKGNDKKASELCNKLVGVEEGYGAFRCWGELTIDFDNYAKTADRYTRELDLDTAICNIKLKGKTAAGHSFSENRMYFVSRPDEVAVMRIERSEVAIGCEIGFSTREPATVTTDSLGILQRGAVKDNGLQFASSLRVSTDGAVTPMGEKLRVDNASYVELYLAADTDYSDNYPAYRTGESAEKLSTRVAIQTEIAATKGVALLQANHIRDYQKLYRRNQIDLGGSMVDVPTDELLKRYPKPWCKPEERRHLEELLYQYGRYLTIASSRDGDVLPSNLQGIWNASDQPAWNSDFHLNVNLQMNYWPTFSSNLAECARPLLRYVSRLVTPGRVTAAAYTGVKSEDGEKNGFLFHTQNTPFGWTCPGWDFSWGWSPAAVGWILHNVYEYYEYTKDKKTLKDEIYPMLKESANYFISLLVADKTGRPVTVPCFSPEHGPRTLGNTYEQSVLAQLLKNAISAADELNADKAERDGWEQVLNKLRPIEIGANGQIKEWYHETRLGKIGQKRHRHMSHLLALFPLNVIDKFKSPEWLDAAKVSMNDRGDKSVGWAMGQRLNTRARTGEGDRALKIVKQLMRYGIHLNLFDVHPPFQIDGNFGYTAGVNEMLMQSNLGCIELLPALPKDWHTGEVNGLIARGNFELNICWKQGKLLSASCLARVGGTAKFRSPSGALKSSLPSEIDSSGCLTVTLKKGEKVEITTQL